MVSSRAQHSSMRSTLVLAGALSASAMVVYPDLLNPSKIMAGGLRVASAPLCNAADLDALKALLGKASLDELQARRTYTHPAKNKCVFHRQDNAK